MAPLNPVDKLVWCAIKSCQGHGKSTWANMETIGKRIINPKGKPTDKSTISRAISRLEKSGFIEVKGKHISCKYTSNLYSLYEEKLTRDQQNFTENYEEKLTRNQQALTRDQQKVDEKSTKVDEKSTRTEKGTIKKEQEKGTIKKRNTHKENKFARNSWQVTFSYRHFQGLKKAGVAPYSALKNETKTIADGADVFDKIVRLDSRTREDIELVLSWLFSPGNWWINNGNYASVKKLRKKSDGQTFFERFLIQAKRQNGNDNHRGNTQSPKQPQGPKGRNGGNHQKSRRTLINTKYKPMGAKIHQLTGSVENSAAISQRTALG